MHIRKKQYGFSLMEVLIATGILAIGFVMIAMIFPAGIKLTSMAAEKTFAPAIAQEALSTLRLYEVDAAKLPAGPPTYFALLSPEHLGDQTLRYLFRQYLITEHNDDTFDPINGTLPAEASPLYQPFMDEVKARLAAETLYPSLPPDYFHSHSAQKQRYIWSALCRRNPTAPQQVQVRLFVCRRSEGLRYYGFSYNQAAGVFTAEDTDHPIPVPVEITATPNSQQVTINSSGGPVYPRTDSHLFFLEGSWVINDQDGRRYQVIKREDLNTDDIYETLTLNEEWQYPSGNYIFWVVPPAVGTGRNLCIEVMEGNF